MVRQINPKKKRHNQQNEGEEIPLRSKRKSSKEKYRHQNNWLEDDDDFDMETDLYRDDDSNIDFEEDEEEDY